MNIIRYCIAVLSIATLYGCKTSSAEDYSAAVIPTHTAESITELRAVVDRALNGTKVTIAKTALTKSSRLILQRKKSIGPDGRVIQTKVDEPPIIFELYIEGNSCFLQFNKTRKKYLLKKANCIKLE